jgi:hypothetical protein
MEPTPTNWSLLLRVDGGEMVEFIDIRQNGCSIWGAQGKPYTTGVSGLIEHASNETAEAVCRQTVSNLEAQGFTLLHSETYFPGELDFGILEDAICAGAREAFLTIRDQHPNETINGFALFTDSYGMTIVPAAMTSTCFENVEEDHDYYRTNPSEWPLSTDAGLLVAYQMILIPSYQYQDIPFEAEVPDYVERFFETCTKALERLDQEGLFGEGDSRNNFLLLFGDSDGGPIQATVRRLNPPAVFERYSGCFAQEF